MNKNNNPLNIKQPDAQVWKGSVGVDDRGHAIFEDPAMGIRAAMRSCQRWFDGGGRTLAALMAHWAPADDTVGSVPWAALNDVDAYARFVAGRLCGAVDSVFTDPADDPLPWAGLLRAMARYEMGEECPWGVVMRGVALWLEDFVDAD
jgi:hypothetical protein